MNFLEQLTALRTRVFGHTPQDFRRNLGQWLPFYETGRHYRREWFKPDLTAGTTVALMAVPQAIAYATIAGIPPVYGLYAAIVLTLIVSLIGNSEHLMSGPTNAIAIVVASTIFSASHPAIRENPVGAVMLLGLMVGLVQLAFGLLQVGNLSQFVSRSVLIGFTAGAGLLIALNQLGPMLGLQLEAGTHLLERTRQTVMRLGESNLYALALGLGTIAFLFVMKRVAPRFPAALTAMVMSAVAVILFDLESKGVRLAGDIPARLPGFESPPFNLGMIADLAGGAIAVAILGCIESLSIAKSISLYSGQKMRNNQDFIGLGVSHIVGSFLQCMPGCGSFTRSALNFQSGGKTRFAGVICALLVALILLLLAPWARYIPTAALAGLLIMLGIGLINKEHIRRAVLSTGSDAAVLILTFVCTLLLHLDTAIYIGVLSSLVLFLRKASSPQLVEYNLEEGAMREIRDPNDRNEPEISIIHVEGELFFGAAEVFEQEVRRLANDPNIKVVILRMKNARHLDATTVAAIEALQNFMKANNRLLVISGASPSVMRVITRSGLLAVMGKENVFPAQENLTAATRQALIRGKEFLGHEVSPNLRIFYDKSRAKDKDVSPMG